MRKLLALCLLLTAVLALAACGSSGASGGQEIPVEMKEWSITPVTAPAGSQVTLVVKNAGTQPHSLALEGTKTETQLIQPGGTAKLSLKVPAKGEYNLVCTVAGHKESGMLAKLTAQ